MSASDKPRIEPADVHVGQQVQRRPYGRFCVIQEISADRPKVLVRDGSRGNWLKMSTLVRDWAGGP
jgi:hypothetical protein